MNNVFRIVESLYLLGEGLIFLLLLTGVLFLLQQLVFRLMHKTLGQKSIMVSSIVGTPVHELSHALFCLLFGHKIKKIVFFAHDSNATLGYVSHCYSNRNPWQIIGNFVIAVAPLLGGIFTIYWLTVFLLPSGRQLLLLFFLNSQKHITEFTLPVVQSLSKDTWLFLYQDYLVSPFKVFSWLYLCAAISLHLCPSQEDLKGSGAGFILVLILLIIVGAFLNYLQLSFLTQIIQWVSPILVLYSLSILLVLLLLFLVAISAGSFFILRSAF